MESPRTWEFEGQLSWDDDQHEPWHRFGVPGEPDRPSIEHKMYEWTGEECGIRRIRIKLELLD